MGQPLRLRVIDGGLEPRVAVAAAPELPAQTFPDRIPLPRARFEGVRMLAGVTIALAVHAGILAYAMQYAGDEEARAEGGADSMEVIEGISIITMDSIDSAFSDGVESLPEAVAAPDAAPDSTPEEVAVAVADAAAPVATDAPAQEAIPANAAAMPDDAAEIAPDEVVDSAPMDSVAALPFETPPLTDAMEAITQTPAEAEVVPDAAVAEAADRIAPVQDEAPAAEAVDAAISRAAPDTTVAAEAVEEAIVAPAEVSAATVADEAVAPLTETDSAVAATGEIVAAESSRPAAAPVNDAEDAVLPADTDASVKPINDTVATAAISDSAAAMPEDTVVAAQDVTPPAVKPEPPPQPKPKPPRQAKPAPKPAKPAAQPPARRSQESTASVAEQAARGPKPGTAGAGGTSNTERGKASLSSYQSKLSAHLRRHRVYPAAARSQSLRGTAVVTFTVNGSGKVTRASLAKSSGHGILDEAAVQMVRRASPFPPIPAGLGQNSITISAPVRFDTR